MLPIYKDREYPKTPFPIEIWDMDSLVKMNLHAEALIARFRADRSSSRAGFEGARVHTNQSDNDSVEISAAASTSAINGVLNDSVVEQINKAIQEAGIDLRIDPDGSLEVSPEGTARKISDFATRYLDAYGQSRFDQPVGTRINGFMSLILGAIQEGFMNVRDFLSGITGLSDSIGESIDRTYEMTLGYLSEFRSAQLAASQVEDPAGNTETGAER